MTTHLTHPEELDGEEPELVLIDDDEFAASHPYEEDDDEFEPDDSDFEIAFADDPDEAVTAHTSSQGHGPDADKRMAGLISAQREVPEEAESRVQPLPLERRIAPTAAIAGTAVAGAVSTPAPRSRREGKAEEKRQRELSKRRKEMDKAAQADEKERHQAEKADAAAALKEASAAEKVAAAEAKKIAAEDKKRADAAAKQRLADDKLRAAEEKKRAAAEKIRLAEEKKRADAAAKKTAEEDKRRADAEAKQRQADDKVRAAAEKERAATEKKHAAAEKVRQAEERKLADAEAKRTALEAKRTALEAKRTAAEEKKRAAAEAKQHRNEDDRRRVGVKRRKSVDKDSAVSASAILELARLEQPDLHWTADGELEDANSDQFDWLEDEPSVPRGRADTKASVREKKSNRGLLVAAAVVIVVAAGGLMYAKTRGHTTTAGTPTAATATVGSALASMNKSSTADVAYSMNLSGGQTVAVDGGGNLDLAGSASSLALTYTGNGYTFPEQLVYDGSSAYYDLALVNHDVAPGSVWVQMDLATDQPAAPGLGAGGALSDPSSLVALLNSSSTLATEVGSTQINGASATEYSINESAAQIARLKDLPSFVSGQLAMEPFTQVTFQVFVNGSGQVSLIEGVGTLAGSGQPVVVHTVLDLSHLGIPVSVAAPPPAQVVSEQQYETDAAHLASTPDT